MGEITFALEEINREPDLIDASIANSPFAARVHHEQFWADILTMVGVHRDQVRQTLATVVRPQPVGLAPLPPIALPAGDGPAAAVPNVHEIETKLPPPDKPA
jgi:hypothetical protein